MKDYSDFNKKKTVESDKKILALKLLHFLVVVLAFSFFVFLILYGYIQLSNRFAKLKYVVVNGNQVLPKRLINTIVANSGNIGFSTYDPSKIYFKIIANPWVKEARVAAIFPDTIYVTIKEKTPSAFVLYNNNVYIIDRNGAVIDEYKSYLRLPKSLPRIRLKANLLNDKSLLKAAINIYEKLDKIEKINYIDVVSDSYQVVNFRNGLKVVVNSFNCPNVAIKRLAKKWTYLSTLINKLDSVSICFDNKFVLKWKKGVGK